MKVVIFVTHLLGTGHLARACVLARAMHADGHKVCVVSGGMPAQHLLDAQIELEQLPPLRSDGVNFTRLLDADGKVAAPHLFEERKRAAITLLEDLEPDAVITELFPFGRRVLTSEFTVILRAAQHLPRRPLICASIRDILAPPSKPAKAEATEAIVSDYYDAVLVHSDEAITPLEISWPVSPILREKLFYTGFVAPAPASPSQNTKDSGGILVSAGGGSVGTALFETSLAAARQTPDLSWHILVGGSEAHARIAELSKAAPCNAKIEPIRPDFRSLLYHTKASVSMCGYNTALDVLQAGAAAVFVPFDAGGETEQSLRARALANLDGIEVLASDALTATRLAESVRRVILAPKREPTQRGMDGATKTAQLLVQLRADTT